MHIIVFIDVNEVVTIAINEATRKCEAWLQTQNIVLIQMQVTTTHVYDASVHTITIVYKMLV